ncbi:hypothetical protein [Nocardioides caricicola]|uniref:Uncharacterized protein n=1 Tax=Nocardioides caricicola TaxID=634770 RepID=A0ABW0MZ90_9ACTN
MDTDIRDEIDRSFDEGPPVDDLDLILTRGRHAVRRRRIAEGASLLLVAGIVTGVALVSSGTTGSSSVGPAGQPSTNASSWDDTGPGELGPTPEEPDVTVPESVVLIVRDDDLSKDWPVTLANDGHVHVHPSVKVVRTLANPFDRTSPSTSVAVEYLLDGELTWFAAYTDEGGGAATGAPASDDTTFQAWVDEQATLQGDGHEPGDTPTAGGEWPGRVDLDLVSFVGTTEVLEASPSVTILEQRAHPNLPDSFATDADRSAVAEVRYDGERWYVLARKTPGSAAQYIAVPAQDGGASLDVFLAIARDRYAEGAGDLL